MKRTSFFTVPVFLLLTVLSLFVVTNVFDIFKPVKADTFIEVSDPNTLTSRTWKNTQTGEYRVVSLVGTALKLETGELIDAKFERKESENFNGWKISQVPIPFSLSDAGEVRLSPDNQDVTFRLEEVGWFDWQNEEFTVVSKDPTYDKNLVENISYSREIGPDVQTLQSDVTWSSIWEGIDLLWKVSSLGVQEKVIMSQQYRQDFPEAQTDDSWMAMRFVLDLPEEMEIKLQTALTESQGEYLDEEKWSVYGLDDKLLAFLPADFAYVDFKDTASGHPQQRKWSKLERRLYSDEGKTWIVVGLPKSELEKLPEGDIVFDPTWQISDTNHDAMSESGTPWAERVTPAAALYGKFYLGIDQYTSSTAYWDGGWKFATTIPQGATITAATIALIDNADNAGSVTGDWYGYDVDSVTNFSGSDTHRVSDHHTRTTATVSHDFTAATGTITSPSLTSILQEIVDRGSYGGNIGLTYRSDTAVGDNWQSWQDYTDNSANAAVLDVTYTTGSSTLEQEGYRWRADDGSETTATWLASQDTNITRAVSTNTRLRMLVNATNDPSSNQYQLEYKLSTDSTYRKVLTANNFASIATSNTTSGTTLAGGAALNMPSGIQAGDLLVVFASNDATGGTGMAISGWTQLFHQQYTGDVVSYGAWAKIAAGSDTATLTGASQDYTAVAIRVVNHGVTTIATDIKVGTPALTSGANPDPPSLDAGASNKWLWVEGYGADDDDETATYWSTSYTGVASVESAQSTSSTISTLAYRQNETQTENPGTMAMGLSEEAVANVIAIPPYPERILLAASSNITASGDNTTALLTAPSGKTTGDFVTGRMQDDENPADAIDITTDNYTELEWSIAATSFASSTQVYQFRTTVAGTALDTYTVTPQMTIGDPPAASVEQLHYRWRNDDGAEGTPAGSGWYDSNWVYRKEIIINAAQVAGTANFTDFPVLISMTHADLKDTGNSGHVGQADGGDILFTNAAGTKLHHEIEKYDPATGELIAWVEVSTLDFDDNTQLYVYYGYAAAANQWDISGAWDSGYTAVYHMNQDPSGSAPQLLNSENNTLQGTSVGSMVSGDVVTGKIGNAIDFDDTNDRIDTTDNHTGNTITLSAWINPRTVDTGDWDTVFMRANSATNWIDWQLYSNDIDHGDGPAFKLNENDDQVVDANEYAANTTVLSTSTWYHLVGTYDGTTITLYKNGTSIDTTTCTSCTIPDSNRAFTIGGNEVWGEYFDGQIDEARISTTARSGDWVATEYNNQNNPAVGGFLTSIGTEETTSTGATWIANEDTAITEVQKLENQRIRFLLSNEGGATSGAQTYTLQVAETGTCSSGTYATVPTDTSGDWQISASSYITDAAATTNIASGLTDENTTFVAGEIKDTGNVTGNITLGTTNFTEIEFSVQATTNATDGGTYCFRLNNVDDYAVYAQATLASGATAFTQSSYRFYIDSDNENVTDPWGDPNIAEDTALNLLPATNSAPENGTEVRLRVALTVSGDTLAATSQQFKLQYKSGTDASCTTGSWTDVGAGGSGSIWRYATSGVTDGTALPSLKLTVSDILGVYAKASPTFTNPNAVAVSEAVEYDFHLQHNGAANASTYSFKVVESDGTALSSYTYCPTLTTSQSTDQELRHGGVFSEEVEQGFTRAD